MLPLRGESAIPCGDGPTVSRIQFRIALARVNHGFHGEGHPGLQPQADARFAVMKHLWLFMKHLTNAMATILSDHRVIVGFGMLLDDVPEVTERGAWFH